MALNKVDFTDEQWVEIQAEADRRATTASDTARKNALKTADAERDELIKAAVADERAKLEMDEQQKLDVERKKVEDAQKALAAERKSLATMKKLSGAGGFSDEAIESLIPIFTSLDDSAFETAIDSFISINKATVESQVDLAKKELLGNGTPPPLGKEGKVDNQTLANEAIAKGDTLSAIDMLFAGEAT